MTDNCLCKGPGAARLIGGKASGELRGFDRSNCRDVVRPVEALRDQARCWLHASAGQVSCLIQLSAHNTAYAELGTGEQGCKWKKGSGSYGRKAAWAGRPAGSRGSGEEGEILEGNQN